MNITIIILKFCSEGTEDSLAEWLRRQPAKLIPSGSVSSNLTGVVLFSYFSIYTKRLLCEIVVNFCLVAAYFFSTNFFDTVCRWFRVIYESKVITRRTSQKNLPSPRGNSKIFWNEKGKTISLRGCRAVYRSGSDTSVC